MISLFDELQKKFEQLTPGQQRIAEFLFDNPNEVLLLNATQIAVKSNVSEATVTRFITALGFSGFSEFKREISQQILRKQSPWIGLTKATGTLDSNNESALDFIIKADLQNIQALGANISTESFEMAVSKLASAKTIYILGLRTSYTCAFYLAFNLRLFTDSVKLITPNVGDVPEQFLHACKEDVLFAISFRRYTNAAIRIAELARKKGVYVIAITNNKLSPMAQLSDLTLIAQTDTPTFTPSYTAPISLLTALVTALSLKDKKNAAARLEELEKNHELFETFCR